MSKLSDTALVLLGKAAERDDRLAIVPPKLPAAARNAVGRSLLRQGLLEVARQLPATLQVARGAGRQQRASLLPGHDRLCPPR
jgi:hypothetical protein